MVCGGIAHNRIVYAVPLRGFGFYSTMSGFVSHASLQHKTPYTTGTLYEIQSQHFCKIKERYIDKRFEIKYIKFIMDLPKTKEELYGTYYLKEDLIKLCKKYNLPSTGSKENLLEYICNLIENKFVNKVKVKTKIKNISFEPSPEKMIDENYSNNEIHRAFFKKIIGDNFKFNVQFMNWMKNNKGKKTYRDAIEMYNKILLDKKSGKKTKIGKQFEYNQYTRDFFENNPELSRKDCIKCWNYKKKQIGNHKYEKDDLKILNSK
jgi:hypothetical protein